MFWLYTIITTLNNKNTFGAPHNHAERKATDFLSCIAICGRDKGWRSGESARLPLMWPGFKSRRRRYMWVEFVVGSLRYSERFFSGYSGFPLSSKTNISKFQFDQASGRRRTTLWMCYLQIIIIVIISFLSRNSSVRVSYRYVRLERNTLCSRKPSNYVLYRLTLFQIIFYSYNGPETNTVTGSMTTVLAKRPV